MDHFPVVPLSLLARNARL